MEQSCNFTVKTKTFVTQKFLNQSGWDLVWVNNYPKCFDTPNLVVIGLEKAEFWGLIRFTRPKGCLKLGPKNEPLKVWRPQFLCYDPDLWICCSQIYFLKTVLMDIFDTLISVATRRAQRQVLWSKIADKTVLLTEDPLSRSRIILVPKPSTHSQFLEL